MVEVTIRHSHNDRLLQVIENMLHREIKLEGGILKDFMTNNIKNWWELTFQTSETKLELIEERVIWLEKVWDTTLAYSPIVKRV